MTVSSNPNETIPQTVTRLRMAFNSGVLRDFHARQKRLARLAECLETYRPRLLEALRKDLGKCESEAEASEISVCAHELHLARNTWQVSGCDESASVRPYYLWLGRSEIHYEHSSASSGSIRPWNYPVQTQCSRL